MRLYLGNLDYGVTSEAIVTLFEEHGTVEDAQVITDFETGESRGFGFLSMPNDDEAQKALQALNGYMFAGRDLRINEAKPKVYNR